MKFIRHLWLICVVAFCSVASAAEWKTHAQFTIPLADDTSAAAIFLDQESLIVAAPGNPPSLKLFEIREKTGPTPNPNPTPTPTPTPNGPLTLIWIEETADRTPAQAAAITDAAIRNELSAAGWKLRVADVDVTNENGQPPSDLAAYIEAARRRGLPCLFAIDAAGAEIYAGKAPANRQEFASLLQRLGLTPMQNTAPADNEAAETQTDSSVTAKGQAPATCRTGTCQPTVRWFRGRK